ncbi:winged helix-turn-helix transcriptional regulator [Gordonia sp. PDNC005]|uniref:MarR family winged helix-turn-helix transcriptional regulator n=1 Tax=unclassified Gordonia (in: high G+C Gram-positive bacteria) TaxID=2657482 RepID=UPI001965BB1B|nr:MarR family winged helix-turn-helix transcriptional regulator [Gordonia sp. PDNC005]QRY61156.1 winged helix-turn-helix transcriptional regulator [Gordonia sp. PDNC005]
MTSRPRSDVLDGIAPLARRLHQRHTRLWRDAVGSDLTGPQYTVLALLAGTDELDHASLGQAAHLDKSTLTPLLNRLGTRGLITERRDESDRRRRLIAISEAGRDELTSATPAAVAAGDELVERLTADERAQLSALLRRALGSSEDDR